MHKLYKSIKIFQSYDHKICSATFLWLTVYVQLKQIKQARQDCLYNRIGQRDGVAWSQGLPKAYIGHIYVLYIPDM